MRHGLSYILGVLVMVAAVAGLVVALYAQSNVFILSRSRLVRLEIYDAALVRAGGGTFVSVTVKNSGNVALTVNTVILEGVAGWGWGVSLEPGATDTYFNSVGALNPGATYTVRVVASTAAGETVEAVRSVTVTR